VLKSCEQHGELLESQDVGGVGDGGVGEGGVGDGGVGVVGVTGPIVDPISPTAAFLKITYESA